MRGLLAKDFRLVRDQMRTIAYMIMIGLTVVYFSASYPFLIFYFSAFGVKLATGTIGYDEFDNGYPYLFALPISRRGYVREKYLFSILMSAAACALALFLSAVAWGLGLLERPAAFTDLLIELFLALQVGVLGASVVMPVYLKFDVEKRSTVLMLVYLGLSAFAVALSWLPSGLGLELTALFQGFTGMKTALLITGDLLLFALLLGGSLTVSCRIIERKEF